MACARVWLRRTSSDNLSVQTGCVLSPIAHAISSNRK